MVRVLNGTGATSITPSSVKREKSWFRIRRRRGPDVNVEARGGDKRITITGEVMWPFILGDRTGGFVDVRGKRSSYDRDNQALLDSPEYNVGGGDKWALYLAIVMR